MRCSGGLDGKGERLGDRSDLVYDEIEKENSTLIRVKEVDLRPLEPNLFTRAWLESKSR
jgi:hypothetical protein